MSHSTPPVPNVVDWLAAGRGQGPDLAWSFVTEGRLNAMAFCRESGESFVADDSGRLARLNRIGRSVSRIHLADSARLLDWSDDGRIGAVVCGENTLHVFDQTLDRLWHMELDAPIRCIAVAPHGSHLFVGREDSFNEIYDVSRRRIGQFETVRPIAFAQFLASTPELVVAAEHGLVGRYDLQGAPVWNEKFWSAVGQMSACGDGSRIHFACFSHGVQVLDVNGENLGSYVLDGTVRRAATTFEPGRVAAATVEGLLFWLNADGDTLWSVAVPDEVHSLACEALADGLLIGFTQGRIVRLRWPSSASSSDLSST